MGYQHGTNATPRTTRIRVNPRRSSRPRETLALYVSYADHVSNVSVADIPPSLSDFRRQTRPSYNRPVRYPPEVKRWSRAQEDLCRMFVVPTKEVQNQAQEQHGVCHRQEEDVAQRQRSRSVDRSHAERGQHADEQDLRRKSRAQHNRSLARPTTTESVASASGHPDGQEGGAVSGGRRGLSPRASITGRKRVWAYSLHLGFALNEEPNILRLSALTDARSWSHSELAFQAGVPYQTKSGRLGADHTKSAKPLYGSGYEIGGSLESLSRRCQDSPSKKRFDL